MRKKNIKSKKKIEENYEKQISNQIQSQLDVNAPSWYPKEDNTELNHDMYSFPEYPNTYSYTESPYNTMVNNQNVLYNYQESDSLVNFYPLFFPAGNDSDNTIQSNCDHIDPYIIEDIKKSYIYQIEKIKFLLNEQKLNQISTNTQSTENNIADDIQESKPNINNVTDNIQELKTNKTIFNKNSETIIITNNTNPLAQPKTIVVTERSIPCDTNLTVYELYMVQNSNKRSIILEALQIKTNNKLNHLYIRQRWDNKLNVLENTENLNSYKHLPAQFIVAPKLKIGANDNSKYPEYFHELSTGELIDFNYELSLVLMQLTSADILLYNYGSKWKQYKFPFIYIQCNNHSEEVNNLYIYVSSESNSTVECETKLVEAPNLREKLIYKNDVIKDINPILFGIQELSFLKTMSYMDIMLNKINTEKLHLSFKIIFQDINNYQIQIKDLYSIPSSFYIKTSTSNLMQFLKNDSDNLFCHGNENIFNNLTIVNQDYQPIDYNLNKPLQKEEIKINPTESVVEYHSKTQSTNHYINNTHAQKKGSNIKVIDSKDTNNMPTQHETKLLIFGISLSLVTLLCTMYILKR